jgi:hypothetical protein
VPAAGKRGSKKMNTIESGQTAHGYVHGSPLRSRYASVPAASLPLAPDAIFLASAAVLIAAGALNATLIYDDVGYLLSMMPRKMQMLGLLDGIKYIFFGQDLGGFEFRLYGLSRVLHLLLYQIFGVHAWAYAAVICATQAACGWGLYRLLRAYQVEKFQAVVCGILWMFSPFVTTSCFHLYSYLILPFQLTLLCALVLRAAHDDPESEQWGRRTVIGAIGLLLAYTGESHIITAGLVVVVVAFLTPSRRTLLNRLVDCLVPLLVIAAAVALYRWQWTALVPPDGRVRFPLMLPGWAQVWLRTSQFFAALPPAAFVQLRAIYTFAGTPALVAAGVAALGGTWILLWSGRLTALRSIAIKLKPVDIAFPLVLGLIALSSFGIFYLIHVLSPAASEMVPFPRRYGFVPHTLVLMFGGACLSAPWMRRLVGAGPAVFYGLAVICTWIVLQTVCLPVVRGQDRQVWNALAAAMNAKRDPSVLLVSGLTPHGGGDREIDLFTPSLRSTEFPAIFESPLTSYWWASGYAHVALGARFVGYWYRDEGEGRLRLLDNGLRGPTQPVLIDSVVVLASTDPNPPDWGKPADRAAIFTDWAAFKAAASTAGTVSK